MAQQPVDKAATTPTKVFGDMQPMLLKYKNASLLDRQIMLTKAMTLVQYGLPKSLTTKEEAKTAIAELTYAKSLFKYANTLYNMENQRPFKVMVDYQDMKLSGKLKNYFEISEQESTLRLKKPIQDIPTSIWIAFRKKQLAHLGDKVIKRDSQGKVSNKGFINADAFDPKNPHNQNPLYPIPIQGMGEINNSAVDLANLNSHGRVRYTQINAPKGPGIALVGGMRGPDDSKLIKILEEYLEESQGDLVTHGKAEYNKVNHVKFLDEIQSQLKAKIKDEEIVNAILNELSVMPTNHDKLIQLLSAINYFANNNKIPKDLASHLLSELPVQLFKLTERFAASKEILANNSSKFEIECVTDERSLACVQRSVVIRVNPDFDFHKWFEETNPDGQNYPAKPADDLAGGKYVHLDFFEALSHADGTLYDHHAIQGFCTLMDLENNAINVNTLNDNGAENYLNAKSKVLSLGSEVLENNANLLLSNKADIPKVVRDSLKNLRTDDLDLSATGRQAIQKDLDTLTQFVSTELALQQKSMFQKGLDATLLRIQNKYSEFMDNCLTTCKGNHTTGLKKFLTGVALVIGTLVYMAAAVSLGTGIGFGIGTGLSLTAAGADLGVTAVAGAALGAVTGFIAALVGIAAAKSKASSSGYEIRTTTFDVTNKGQGSLIAKDIMDYTPISSTHVNKTTPYAFFPRGEKPLKTGDVLPINTPQPGTK